jgi:hypothetical protein
MQEVPTSRLIQTCVRGPAGHLEPAERRERRAVLRALRSAADGAPKRFATLVVLAGSSPQHLAIRKSTRWSRAMCRLFATTLDRRIAQGRSPESHRLAADRSRILLMPAQRQQLAYRWADLLVRARRPPFAGVQRVHLNRSEILANEPSILALLDRLVAPTPGSVRAIALLNSLLSDGSGPVYNWRCPTPLGRLLEEASALLSASEF